ncbi:MAG: glycosyl transferase family protein [archaeon GW2011_AR18]|nr:MAG: glycosyl transferase family protein [archaeon GW2011_AR18]
MNIDKSFYCIMSVVFGLFFLIISGLLSLFNQLYSLCGYCSIVSLNELKILFFCLGIIIILFSLFILKSNKDIYSLMKIVIPIILIFLFFIAFNKVFNQDEIEHLHVSWLIANGGNVYQEFIEFHTPLLLFIISLFFKVFGNSLSALYAARMFSFMIFLLLVYMTFILAKRLYNKNIAYISVILLVFNSVFFSASTEILLDGFSALLNIIAIYLIILDKKKFAFISGLLFALAFFTTQKSAVIIIFVVLWLFFQKKYVVMRNVITGGIITGVLGFFMIFIGGLWNDFFYQTFFVMFAWHTDVPVIAMVKGIMVEYSLFILLLLMSLNKLRFKHDIISFLFLGQVLIFISLIFSISWIGRQDFIFLSIIISIIIARGIYDSSDNIKRFFIIVMIIYLVASSLFIGRYIFSTNDIQLRTTDFVLSNSNNSDLIIDVKPTAAIFRKDTSFLWYNRIEAIPAMQKIGYNISYNFSDELLKKPKILLRYGLLKDEIAILYCYDEIVKDSYGAPIKPLFLYNSTRCT